jgi:tRNA A37 threonylcarbamoyladenosine dehydratase
MDIKPLLERSSLVFGEQGIERLSNSHVLVVGVGGVGGFVIEALARAGVGKITIVDHDIVSATNLNRQIIALHSTINLSKVTVMKERVGQINPECKINLLNKFLKAEDMEDLLAFDFDYVIDAIDSLNSKVKLVETAYKRNLKVISSMGAGRRVDPTKVSVTDFSKTHSCGLARQFRQRLIKRGIKKGIKAVFSTELPMPAGPMEKIDGARDRVINGTASYMPGIFGLILAGIVIKELSSKTNNY